MTGPRSMTPICLSTRFCSFPKLRRDIDNRLIPVLFGTINADYRWGERHGTQATPVFCRRGGRVALRPRGETASRFATRALLRDPQIRRTTRRAIARPNQQERGADQLGTGAAQRSADPLAAGCRSRAVDGAIGARTRGAAARRLRKFDVV